MDTNTSVQVGEIKNILHEFAVNFDEAKLVAYVMFGCAMLIIALVQVYLRVKYKKDMFELERRKASNEVVRDFAVGNIGNKMDDLKKCLNKIGCKDYLWNPDKNIKDIMQMQVTIEAKTELTKEDKVTLKHITSIRLITHDLINYYEYIANGIELHSLNEEIIHNFYALIFIDFRRWSRVLVVEDESGVTPWTQYAELADRWEKGFKEKDEEVKNWQNSLQKIKLDKVHKKLKKL